MFPKFKPLFYNSHLATIAGNFWPRQIEQDRFPATPVRYRIDKNTTILALEHQPRYQARAQLVCLHGLEGSANAGYVQSLAQAALQNGFGVHRLNLRTCGGTEELSQTMYHSGLTGDTWEILQRLRTRFNQPIFLVGFSLGGNVALKLAGERNCAQVLSGLCSISAPVDLAACVREIDKPYNFLYARRFLNRLKGRIRRKNAITPDLYSIERINEIKSVWEFDDHYTAPLFGFGTAANYYATQSARNFLADIAIPGLLVTAQDDPLVPFRTYQQCQGLASNSLLQLLAPCFGGHVGFISRTRPRFWIDNTILKWVGDVIEQRGVFGTAASSYSSL